MTLRQHEVVLSNDEWSPLANRGGNHACCLVARRQVDLLWLLLLLLELRLLLLVVLELAMLTMFLKFEIESPLARCRC